MRWLVVLLCGCNQLFGVAGVVERDAAFYDSPADAASTCPSGQAPEFSPVLHQVLVGRCYEYSVVAGRAACACFTATGYGVCEGPADARELPLIDLGLAGFNGQINDPRLTPDAGELFIRVFDYDTSQQAIYGYVRQPDGSWHRNVDPPFAVGGDATLGTFANGPGGIRTIVTSAADSAMHEWVREAGVWREVQIVGQAPPPLGVGSSPRSVDMIRDGLHAIVATESGAYYLERASLDAAFEPARVIPGVPGESPSDMLTDDCGRVYVTGLGGVFYVQRR